MKKKRKNKLDRHKKEGKKLISPMNQIPNLNFTKWTDRLPDYLYAALLTAKLPQNEYLKKFRQMVMYFSDSKEEYRPKDLSLTTLGKCDENYLFHSLNQLIDSEEIEKILRPLLLFEKIPAYSVWNDIITCETNDNDWDVLKEAIGKTLYHQSQEATDIRWFRLVYQIGCNKLFFLPGTEHVAEEIFSYPNKGDMRKVRPSIRAAELNLSALDDDNNKEWRDNFWNTCLFETEHEILVEKRRPQYKIDEELSKRFKSIWNKLFQSFYDTLKNSSADAKHDASFGFVMYSLRILTECVNRNLGNYLIGRILLRSLVENYITFAYLVKMNKIELWEAYRIHGAGQAKLVSLKAEKYESDPSFISFDDVNKIANEDMSEEFVDIDVGHWAGVDLRKMSEKSDTKKIYDKYYDWTSGHSHGNWAAVRDSIYTTDFNPLHRLMRVPSPKLDFNDVIGDMMEIMNLQLLLLSELYELEDLTI